MPRLWIEYHSSLASLLDKEALVKELIEACSVPSVNPFLIKTRLVCPEITVLGPWEERERGAYLYILFEWLEGRPLEVEALLVQRIRETLSTHTALAKATIENLSVTFEIRKISHEQHHVL